MQVTAVRQAANFVSAFQLPMVTVVVLELLASIGADTHSYHLAEESAFPGQCL